MKPLELSEAGRARRNGQIMQAAKCEGEITCRGVLPEKDDSADHGLKLPIWLAYRCLYCGFYFCQSCAESHFGKSRGQNANESKEKKP